MELSAAVEAIKEDAKERKKRKSADSVSQRIDAQNESRTDAHRAKLAGSNRVIELGSLRELITLKPLEGWGEDPKKIEAVIKDDPELLVMWREEMKEQGRNQHSKPNNVREAVCGNSKSYTLSRLEKHNPELFAEVLESTLTANAAAIMAARNRFTKTKLSGCHDTRSGLFPVLTSSFLEIEKPRFSL